MWHGKDITVKIDQNTKFLIVGMGLLGGSYAKALTKQGFTVYGLTRRQSSIDYALKDGMIQKGSIDTNADFIGQADVVVFALYPHVFLEWIAQHQEKLKSGAILTDVTGVKTGIVDKVQEMLREDLEFIGAHPMAGREVYGVENSDERIFRGANYIVTPTEKNTPYAIAFCEELGRVLGFARVTTLTPKEHDEIIGFVSQLTHCIAISLMTCKDNEHLVDYTGDSFRDLTRIARINDEMWSELFLLNKKELIQQIDIFEAELLRLRNMLEQNDEEGIREMMRLSTKRRALFDKKV